ncbi:MAG: hypothetical protein HY537_14980 [Deltaproteobacteria bacterium]|nr:hypothetical protein [Deltaproteobacteria bacterium]
MGLRSQKLISILLCWALAWPQPIFSHGGGNNSNPAGQNSIFAPPELPSTPVRRTPQETTGEESSGTLVQKPNERSADTANRRYAEAGQPAESEEEKREKAEQEWKRDYFWYDDKLNKPLFDPNGQMNPEGKGLGSKAMGSAPDSGDVMEGLRSQGKGSNTKTTAFSGSETPAAEKPPQFNPQFESGTGSGAPAQGGLRRSADEEKAPPPSVKKPERPFVAMCIIVESSNPIQARKDIEQINRTMTGVRAGIDRCEVDTVIEIVPQVMNMGDKPNPINNQAKNICSANAKHWKSMGAKFVSVGSFMLDAEVPAKMCNIKKKVGNIEVWDTNTSCAEVGDPGGYASWRFAQERAKKNKKDTWDQQKFEGGRGTGDTVAFEINVNHRASSSVVCHEWGHTIGLGHKEDGLEDAGNGDGIPGTKMAWLFKRNSYLASRSGSSEACAWTPKGCDYINGVADRLGQSSDKIEQYKSADAEKYDYFRKGKYFANFYDGTKNWLDNPPVKIMDIFPPSLPVTPLVQQSPKKPNTLGSSEKSDATSNPKSADGKPGDGGQPLTEEQEKKLGAPSKNRQDLVNNGVKGSSMKINDSNAPGGSSGSDKAGSFKVVVQKAKEMYKNIVARTAEQQKTSVLKGESKGTEKQVAGAVGSSKSEVTLKRETPGKSSANGTASQARATTSDQRAADSLTASAVSTSSERSISSRTTTSTRSPSEKVGAATETVSSSELSSIEEGLLPSTQGEATQVQSSARSPASQRSRVGSETSSTRTARAREENTKDRVR